jgi:hypothetical protein
MPTVLLIKGFRFLFYSNENNEPEYIHVRKASAEGKLWLAPQLAIAYFHGFTTTEEREIWEIAQTNQDYFKQKWNEYFGK